MQGSAGRMPALRLIRRLFLRVSGIFVDTRAWPPSHWQPEGTLTDNEDGMLRVRDLPAEVDFYDARHARKRPEIGV